MDDHGHCRNCFSLSCSSSYDGCPLATCEDCGLTIHQCKLEDHSTICPDSTIKCINSPYGCPSLIKRNELRNHLSSCPLITSRMISTEMVSCKHCSQEMESTYQLDHYLICDEFPVQCTNARFGCKKVMKRKEVNCHIAHCPASVKQCMYAYTRGNPTHSWNIEEKDKTSLLPDEQFLLSDQKFQGLNSGNAQSLSLSTSKFAVYYFPNLSRDAASLLSKGQRVYYSGSFVCGCFIRRDDFASHWSSHTELMEDLSLKICRCPMADYGCQGAVNYFLPLPKGYTFQYKDFFNSFVLVPPQIIQTGQDGDDGTTKGPYAALIEKKKQLSLYGYEDIGSCNVLGQLPVEVLLLIFSHLDSLSLWSLSQVNRYFRVVCEEMLPTRGVVYSIWEKEKNEMNKVMLQFSV